MSTLRAYGKVNDLDQARLQADRKKTRRRIAIICLSCIVLVVIIVGVVLGTTRTSEGDNDNDGGNNLSPHISNSIKAVCDITLYKDSCYNSLSPLANSTELTPQDIFRLSMEVAISEISKVARYFSDDNNAFKGDNITASVMENCRELLSLAIDHVNDSLSSTAIITIEAAVDDLRTWLSSAETYQQTCIDGFKEINNDSIDNHMKLSLELTSNSLAIVTWISKVTSAFNLNRRRLMNFDAPRKENQWPLHNERMLAESSDKLKKKADIIVAKDGSGKYKTIMEAMRAVPEKNKRKRTVIYVKKGVYKENVRVEKNKWNVTMVGDGMNSTIVTWNLNFVDGTPTYSTATFAVFGKGFVARDMAFVNTAGPQKHQAVALMSTADQSIFHRCRFDGFQDTLYAHSNRQFYRECDIIGTVDFIFGNSAVVFQNCNILPRQPMANQQNTITAQGKVDPNQNTGISIQNCTVSPYGNLSSSLRTYLGRPWKKYSTTVLMYSNLGSLVNPAGWLPWTGNSAPDTIFYSEYKNIGPGSWTKNRVKWKGLRNLSEKEAKKFTVKEFINGDKWISHAGVTYESNL